MRGPGIIFSDVFLTSWELLSRRGRLRCFFASESFLTCLGALPLDAFSPLEPVEEGAAVLRRDSAIQFVLLRHG